jgi:hypothetical protein
MMWASRFGRSDGIAERRVPPPLGWAAGFAAPEVGAAAGLTAGGGALVVGAGRFVGAAAGAAVAAGLAAAGVGGTGVGAGAGALWPQAARIVVPTPARSSRTAARRLTVDPVVPIGLDGPLSTSGRTRRTLVDVRCVVAMRGPP